MEDYAGKAMRFVRGVDFGEFHRNEEKVLAVIRALEVIGEAAKKIPEPVRGRFPDIPWKDAAGMRDKLIHDYTGVDSKVLWETLRDDIPPLRKAVRKALKELGEG
jgi:uncharacterized protein with HEPN domain